jgi:hypothetical protein
MLLNDAVVSAFTTNKAITHGFPEHNLNMEPHPAECDIKPNMSFNASDELSAINESHFNHVLNLLDKSIVNNDCIPKNWRKMDTPFQKSEIPLLLAISKPNV